MANFNSPEGDIAQIYLSDTEILERYVGNQLWVWGRNNIGQLGLNDIVDRSSPVQTIAGGTNWKQVSSGDDFTAAIKTDGTLWLWGDNANGELGNNSIVHRSSPVQVGTNTNWKQVSVHTCTAAIKTDGTLWVWGPGASGQLGTNDTASRSSPVQTISGGTNWKQVSVGSTTTAAIKTDGTLWVWGSGSLGALGTNDIAARSSPVQTIAGGTNWKQVSAGFLNIAAIKTDGTLWIWGSNANGKLGTNDTANRSSPVQVGADTNWKQLSVGVSRSAAIKIDGTLWVWGFNTQGILGTNDIVDRSSPVQTIAGGTNWKQVNVGGYTMAAIKTDGTLWNWGNNNSGSLGTNDTVGRSSPVQTVAGGTNWKQAIATKSNSFIVNFGITYTES